MQQTTATLDLVSLSEGMPGLNADYGEFLCQSAAVCLDQHAHRPGVRLVVEGALRSNYMLHWPNVSEQIRRSYADLQMAVEYAAIGVAIAVIRDITGLSVIGRSFKAAGFDFWLGTEADALFQHKVRLEVSGILRSDEATIRTRLSQKYAQVSRLGDVPILIAVVEFGTPRMLVAQL